MIVEMTGWMSPFDLRRTHRRVIAIVGPRRSAGHGKHDHRGHQAPPGCLMGFPLLMQHAVLQAL
jgi:hypothetical protein